MKSTRIALVFASFLLAGLLSEAAYAACPCKGTNNACGNSSNPPKGLNGCTNSPDGLVDLTPVLPGTTTDGTGCIEVTSGLGPMGADGVPNCEACIGGAIRGSDAGGDLVLVRGAVCTANPTQLGGGWNCISTAGVDEGDPTNLMVVPVVELGILTNGTSNAEAEAAAGCTLGPPPPLP